MSKASEVFKKIRFAKLDKQHDKAGPFSTDDEEHGAVSEIEWNQQLKHQKHRAMQEEEQLDEKNVPTNPSLWSRAKALARSKFDVYPSAYANGWASKWYKSKGGGWKTVSEGSDMKSARIIKDLYKKKGVSDQDKWKEEYKKARAAGSSSSNAKARANGAVYEEQQVQEAIETTREFHLRQAAYHEKEGNKERAKYHNDQANDWRIKANHDATKQAEREIAYKYGSRKEEVELDEGMMKRIATDREEDARLAKSKSWKVETPWIKSKGTVTDKSGAKHTAMSTARDLARKAAQKNVKESVSITESRLADIVREAAEKAKKKKKEETKKSDDTFQPEPELSSQIIRND